MAEFKFTPVTLNDISLIHNWMTKPHLKNTWGHEVTKESLQDKFIHKINRLELQVFIIIYKETPIGFIQSYNTAHTGPDWWPDQPAGTFGIDFFIGEEEFLGRGLGAELIREFSNNLLTNSEVNNVICDPHPNNFIAIAACERAGFKKVKLITTPDGDAVLMKKTRIFLPIPKLKIPSKFQPRGFRMIYEDPDIIVGEKSCGLLTVAAKWEEENTVENLVGHYLRKGNKFSRKSAFIIHRLDQATSGLLVIAKSEEIQQKVKNDWKNSQKTYICVVHGKPPKTSGLYESYLSEDDDYFVHSNKNATENSKLAQTEYEVIKSDDKYSLIKVNLLTGKKNQIRVHMSEMKCPIVGDTKYGKKNDSARELMLHAYSLELNHPFKKDRIFFRTKYPVRFEKYFYWQTHV